MNIILYRQIRAVYNESTIRVYQAYSDNIAETALKMGTFVSPPFKTNRMTWIKPSFLWMMYRSDWGTKPSQNRILAIDITRKGFEWALEHSLLSQCERDVTDKDEWIKMKNTTPVRIQWDPERDLFLRPLDHRSIQIGLSKEAVNLYINQWITNISDFTELTDRIHSLVVKNKIQEALALLPKEINYPITSERLKIHLGAG